MIGMIPQSWSLPYQIIWWRTFSSCPSMFFQCNMWHCSYCLKNIHSEQVSIDRYCWFDQYSMVLENLKQSFIKRLEITKFADVSSMTSWSGWSAWKKRRSKSTRSPPLYSRLPRMAFLVNIVLSLLSKFTFLRNFAWMVIGNGANVFVIKNT